ncbi:MAG: helix-turn-helix transcriptional regulator [Pseudomonadota bacterium]|nr:helix-turn-helix transcriptional regulator [Pseudomonadota bacterium]
MINNENMGRKGAAMVSARGRAEVVDTHVGGRLRQRRRFLGMSQQKLGEALGLTFQQVQKYERGANRIGASRLHHISEILDVPINYFFDDICPSLEKKSGKPGLTEARPNCHHDPIAKKETLELVQSYCRIKDPKVRGRLFALTKQLGKSFSDN